MSSWNARIPNDCGEYEVTFSSKDHEKEKAIEKVCKAIMDGSVNSPNDVSIVRHGNWLLRCDTHRDNVTGEVDEDYHLECSECKRKVFDISQDAVIQGRWLDVIKDCPYCHCGAKMDGCAE